MAAPIATHSSGFKDLLGSDVYKRQVLYFLKVGVNHVVRRSARLSAAHIRSRASLAGGLSLLCLLYTSRCV